MAGETTSGSNRRRLSIEELVAGVRAGERAAIGRAITLVESNHPEPFLSLKVDDVHVVNATDVGLPVDRWFKLAYLFDQERGIAVYLDDELVIDYPHVFPHAPSPMMIMKVYGGDSGLGYLAYWDEIRWYAELPSALEQPFGG